eukprot:scaffold4196_cov350-Prasinococcus_capsulatus_cf.AAC.5
MLGLAPRRNATLVHLLQLGAQALEGSLGEEVLLLSGCHMAFHYIRAEPASDFEFSLGGRLR